MVAVISGNGLGLGNTGRPQDAHRGRADTHGHHAYTSHSLSPCRLCTNMPADCAFNRRAPWCRPGISFTSEPEKV